MADHPTVHSDVHANDDGVLIALGLDDYFVVSPNDDPDGPIRVDVMHDYGYEVKCQQVVWADKVTITMSKENRQFLSKN